jgi:hypothetical protein
MSTRLVPLVVASLAFAIAALAQVKMASLGNSNLSHILPPSSAYRFPAAEKLTYSVQWHMLNAGTAIIFMQRAGSQEHLSSTAESAGLANKLFHVHDIFDADIDPRSFCTQQISKHSEEGPRRLDRSIYFDYPHAKSLVDDRDLKTGKQKHSEFDIPPCVSDVVSGFFYARSLPLQLGFSQVFPVNDGGKTTDVRINVEARENIKGPMGEFQTLRVKAEPISGPMTGKGETWVWLTDDARRVPVQMKSKLGFASLLFQLQQMDSPTSR